MQPFPPEIFDVHALQQPTERMLLYALICGLKPNHVLEIGTGFGGGAQIINAALESNGAGVFASIDPRPQNGAEELFSSLKRGMLIKGYSPAAIVDALLPFQPRFDFVFIDGDHSCEAVLADIRGVIPCLMPEAYLLFHDAFYGDVEKAINQALEQHSQLTDCGLLSREFSTDEKGVKWGGMRLLKWTV